MINRIKGGIILVKIVTANSLYTGYRRLKELKLIAYLICFCGFYVIFIKEVENG